MCGAFPSSFHNTPPPHQFTCTHARARALVFCTLPPLLRQDDRRLALTARIARIEDGNREQHDLLQTAIGTLRDNVECLRALNERRRDEGPSSSGGSGAGKTAADKKKKKAHEEAKYLMKKK